MALGKRLFLGGGLLRELLSLFHILFEEFAGEIGHGDVAGGEFFLFGGVFLKVIVHADITRFLFAGIHALQEILHDHVAVFGGDPFEGVEEGWVLGPAFLGKGLAESFVANLFVESAEGLGIDGIFFGDIARGGGSLHQFIDEPFLIGPLQLKAGNISSEFDQRLDRGPVICHDDRGASAVIDISTIFDGFSDSVARSYPAGEVELAVCEGIVQRGLQLIVRNGGRLLDDGMGCGFVNHYVDVSFRCFLVVGRS